MMKSFAAISCLLLFVTMLECNADLTNKLIGTWTGNAVTSYDGEKASASFTNVTKRFEKHGLISTSTVRIPGQPISKSILRHYDSGKVGGSVMRGGQTLGIVEGTWKISDNRLTVRSTVSTILGDFQQTSKTILTSRRKMSAVSTASNGLRIVGTATKR